MNRLIDFSSRFRILKGGKISLVVSAMLGSAIIASAGPSGGTVTSGTATISSNGTVTNIDQSTAKATINWQTFSIATGETVNFNQPDSSSITLNRVIGNEKSIIDGALNANGQVWLLNSNGVLFSKNASINTSGILATTAELSDSDFNAGNYDFKNSSSNSVINQGTINVSNAGSVVLASNEVINEGTIKAVKGKVHLVGADSYSLNLNGNSLLNLRVDKGVLDALVKNSGHIVADGGEIYLTTNAVDELLKGVVNNTGIIEANSIDSLTGYVELFAHGGEAQIGGSIEAVDGFVETSGKEFTILEDASIKAGDWLIDPIDITIDDTLAGTIETALGSGDVTITTDGSNTPDTSSGESGTNGDITVNSDITWGSAQKLTLDAEKNIYINADITASNIAGQVELLYGQGAVEASNTGTYDFGLTSSGFAGSINLKAGDNFFTKLGSDGTLNTWTVVNNATDMQVMTLGDSTKRYVLGANIILSGTNNWTPIGEASISSNIFRGSFDGLGHTVSNLDINDNTKDYVGLFGAMYNNTIKNIGVTNINLTGKRYTGGILAYAWNGKVSNTYSTGTVNGTNYAGGLIGANSGGSGSLTNSYSTGNISGDTHIGGLMGSHIGLASNLYSTGDVSGDSYIGGLIGYNNGSLSYSYSTGDISGTSNVGGIVGYGSSSNSYSTSGINPKTMLEMQSYATFKDDGWTIFRDSSLGVITPTFTKGGWIIGKTPLTIAGTVVAGKTYDGATDATFSNVGTLSGSVFTGDSVSIDTNNSNVTFTNKNVGTNVSTNISLAFLGSELAYYSISQPTGITADITKKALTITGTTASDKTYDGTTTATVNVGTLSGFEGNETVTTTAAGTFNSKDVGTRTATISYTLADGINGGIASNYSLANTNDNADITKKVITVSADDLEKVEGELDSILTYTANGLITGDTLSGILKRALGETAGEYIISQNTLANSNYTITFVAGKYIITANPTNDVDNIITSITNTNVLKVEAPKLFNAPILRRKATQNTKFNLVSTPVKQNQNTKVVLLSELKQTENNDVVVPVGDNSIISLINGGVTLPEGVDQQFYVVADEAN